MVRAAANAVKFCIIIILLETRANCKQTYKSDHLSVTLKERI
jgi:hypothetical protein